MSLLERLGITGKETERVRRTELRGLSLVRLGLVAMVISFWLVYMGFSRAIPWQRAFELNAAFKQTLNIRANSPVRIAGVNVGKVITQEHVDGSTLTTVRMEIEDNGLPVHEDATLKIRPRTFLEGSYFVELKPGTPSAPELESGDTVPVSQTASGVQIGQVLTALQSNNRKDLQELLQELGKALDRGEESTAGGEGRDQAGTGREAGTDKAQAGAGDTGGGDQAAETAGESANATDEAANGGDLAAGGGDQATVDDEAASGDAQAASAGDGLAPTAGEATNSFLRNSGPGFKAGAQVSQAMLGTEPGDLSKLITGLEKVVSALDQNEVQLKELITNMNVTTGALAAVNGDLSATIRELPRTLAAAKPALAHLNEALPPLRTVAREIRPGIREIPATVDATLPWIEQARSLMGDDELGGVARKLRPAAADLAEVSDGAIDLFPEMNLFAKCFNKVLIPTLKTSIVDPPYTDTFPPTENYKLFLYSLVGWASAGQSFDGNGPFMRSLLSGGSATVSSGPINGTGSTLLGKNEGPLLGYRPKLPGEEPEKKPDVACYTNTAPDLNGAETGAAAASTTGGGTK